MTDEMPNAAQAAVAAAQNGARASAREAADDRTALAVLTTEFNNLAQQSTKFQTDQAAVIMELKTEIRGLVRDLATTRETLAQFKVYGALALIFTNVIIAPVVGLILSKYFGK